MAVIVNLLLQHFCSQYRKSQTRLTLVAECTNIAYHYARWLDVSST